MKEATNFIRAMGQMSQSTQCFGFHIRETENASSPQAMRLHLSPNALTRIQFRTIPGQPIHAQIPPVASDFSGYFARLMGRMTIPNQKDRFRSPNHQTIHKSANHLPIHFNFSIINRIRPRRFTTLSMFNRYRAPVLLTTGVCPLRPQVVPA